MRKTKELLKSVFGFDAFRPGQEEVVAAILAGRDVLAIMPTGGGKSLCYQLPALRHDGLTVVISPLIALMRDQVSGLREAGVEAGALNSANDPWETERVFEALEAGKLRLLYMAPERLAFAPDGKTFALATGKGEGMGRVELIPIDLQNPIELSNPNITDFVASKPHAHTRIVRGVAYTRDGRFLLSVSGGRDKGELRVWALPNGEPVEIDNGKLDYGARNLAISPNGRRLIVSTSDAFVDVFDLEYLP